jgi:hypothetical protein
LAYRKKKKKEEKEKEKEKKNYLAGFGAIPQKLLGRLPAGIEMAARSVRIHCRSGIGLRILQRSPLHQRLKWVLKVFFFFFIFPFFFFFLSRLLHRFPQGTCPSGVPLLGLSRRRPAPEREPPDTATT